MRHAREDYNRIQDPAGKIPANEPVFLLRGQDRAAPATLAFWAKEVRMLGGDEEIANMAESQAIRMLKWQEEYKSKLPDLPKK